MEVPWQICSSLVVSRENFLHDGDELLFRFGAQFHQLVSTLRMIGFVGCKCYIVVVNRQRNSVTSRHTPGGEPTYATKKIYD